MKRLSKRARRLLALALGLAPAAAAAGLMISHRPGRPGAGSLRQACRGTAVHGPSMTDGVGHGTSYAQ
jgi:hypothetical protein